MPQVEATAEDIPAVVAIVTGGNPSHYWEDSGRIGYLYEEVLGIDVFAYDVWMVYKPGIRWEEGFPPRPDFWMHNLWNVTKEQGPRLDSKAFAHEVNKLLNTVR